MAQGGFSDEAEAISVEFLDTKVPSEARGRKLPLYAVKLDHPTSPNIYVDAVTGEIVARRNR